MMHVCMHYAADVAVGICHKSQVQVCVACMCFNPAAQGTFNTVTSTSADVLHVMLSC